MVCMALGAGAGRDGDGDVAVMVWDSGSDTGGGDMLLKTLYSVASIGYLDYTQHICASGK